MPDDFQLQMLLEASSFGPDAHFASIGGRTVLVTESGQPARVVQLDAPVHADTPPGQYTVFGLPASDLSVVDVVDDGALDISSRVYALVCREETSCSVWRSPLTRAGDLEEIPGSELAWRPRGLAIDPASSPALPCVYGPSLKCFDAAWYEPLTPPDGVEIVDVALGSAVSFVIGTRTHAWIRTDPDGNWEPQWVAPRDIELSGVQVSSQYGAAFGTHREVLVMEENLTWVCQWNSELALVSPSTVFDRISVVTTQGRVLRRARQPGSDFCISQQLDIGPILSSSRVQCGASGNNWLLTENAIWGEYTCLEVP